VEFTAEQRRAVEHGGPRLVVAGGPGTGKTTVLRERYRRLVAAGPASRVLVVTRDRAAADRFVAAVLPGLRGGFDALPITTVWGLAYDVLARGAGGGAPPRLVGAAEQGALVRRLLAEEDPARWPRYGRLLRRPALAAEVLRQLADPSAAMPEVAAFAARYRRALEESGRVDAATLLTRAAGVARPGRYDHVLVDDADALTPDGLRLVEAVGGAHALVGGPGEPAVALTASFRAAPPGTLVLCGHPSAEAEAVAGELRAAHLAGTPWQSMAVLVRATGRRARSIARALSRHGIPVTAGLAPARDEPVVAAIVGELREAHATGSRGRPAEVAYDLWASRFTAAADDRALDAVVALVEGLDAYGTLEQALVAIDEGAFAPAPWRAAASAATAGEGVTITSIAAAAGREWATVVVAGVVEGELPAARADRAAERRLWALATSRATRALVAVAAPAPGVLLSRFVESWPRGDVRLPGAPGRRLPPRPPTAGAAPVWPGGRLQLSASQLDTYDDCPLRYAYHYALRAREESGIHAALGTLVHDVLHRFLSEPPPRTVEGLMAAAGEVWSDEIGRFRPQVEEARRDFVAMLTAWWEGEGVHDPAPLATEREFAVEVGPHRLTGRIDRVDRADDGVGLRVLDYKTGKREPRPGDMADDLQLAVYHLAAVRDPELAALGPPTQLQLRYLRTMHRFDQAVTEDHEERTEARVLAVADRILAEDFTPSVDAMCRNCSYHRLCPLQPPGRRL